MQMRLMNDRAELMRKEIALNRKESIDEHNQLIFKYSPYFFNCIVSLQS